MKNATRKKRSIKLSKRNVRRVRRNQGEIEGADFPVGEVVDVEAIRINSDGTLDVFVEDVQIPESVALSENRRRNKPRKKAKNRKRR